MTKAEMLRRLRFGDIRRLLRSRYGAVLPDDDAGREDLIELLRVVSLHPGDASKIMRNQIQVWAPWMEEDESDTFIQLVELIPVSQRWRSNAEQGEQFNLTNEQRERDRLWTMVPVDVDLEDVRREKRRARQRRYLERRRRESGVISREAYEAGSLSRLKPWLAHGVSRRTWYRQQSKMAEVAQKMAQVCLPINSILPVSTLVPRHGRRLSLRDAPTKQVKKESGLSVSSVALKAKARRHTYYRVSDTGALH